VKKKRFFSYGYSGTKYITRLTAKYIECKHENIRIPLPDGPTGTPMIGPHIPFDILASFAPARFLSELSGAVLIYADPRNAVLSLLPVLKTSRNLAAAELRASYRRHKHASHIFYENEYPPTEPEPDFKPFYRFFNSWLASEAPFDICFLKYEKIVENRYRLADFLEIPEDKKELYCSEILTTFRSRKSNYKKLPAKKQDELNEMFSELIDIQSVLGDFWIKEKKCY